MDHIQLKLPVEITFEGDHWYCVFRGFEVIGAGHNPNEAVANAIEAMVAFIEVCKAQGTLEKSVKEAGFRLEKKESGDVATDGKYEVPFELLKKYMHDHHTH
ncbi:MAG: hypothetical protein OEW12_06595 [Deltaproteobacteria bacterium]|nr:hypothetical protein [Deltaproteobacteria bacterium]